MSRIRWYPGHQKDALETIAKQIKGVDLVIEVRDARIPISSRHEQLEELIGLKKRMVIFNKADLADPSTREDCSILSKRLGYSDHLVTSLLARPSTAKHTEALVSWCRDTLFSSRKHVDVGVAMILGIPNCGKSTLINNLKHMARERGFLATGGDKTKHASSMNSGGGGDAVSTQRDASSTLLQQIASSTGAVIGVVPSTSSRRSTRGGGGRARTGASPGITRHVSSFQLLDHPRLFVLDTPGIAWPSVPDDYTGYKLALTTALPDHVVDGPQDVVAFLAAWLAREKREWLEEAVEAVRDEYRLCEEEYSGIKEKVLLERAERSLQKQWMTDRQKQSNGTSFPIPIPPVFTYSEDQLAAAILSEQHSHAKRKKIPRPEVHRIMRDRLGFLSMALDLATHSSTRPLLLDLPSETQHVVSHVAESFLLPLLSKDGYLHGRESNAVSGFYARILRSFRDGELGRHTLDDVPSYLFEREAKRREIKAMQRHKAFLSNLPIDQPDTS